MNCAASRMQAMSPDKCERAFSLVEVVFALGLVSFCLLVLLALLPAGLTTAKNAREQTAAASLAEEISTGIRNASTNSSGNYTVAGVCTNLTWTLGGSAVSTNCNFTLGGAVPTTTTGSQLQAQVVVTPPATASSSGTALISVAWPQTAQWYTSTSSWSNAVGSVDSWIIFVPRK
jgi:uncharacterized protein (TIGR02598 family)